MIVQNWLTFIFYWVNKLIVSLNDWHITSTVTMLNLIIWMLVVFALIFVVSMFFHMSTRGVKSNAQTAINKNIRERWNSRPKQGFIDNK